ncbi:MAG: hypothetical protein F4X58_01085 [Chloroflexi bacterium]|nr:hypothetical protein [Chloroflexota bacterium]MYC00500.1 hypothetical protein [Chloroflexota bacterium]
MTTGQSSGGQAGPTAALRAQGKGQSNQPPATPGQAPRSSSRNAPRTPPGDGKVSGASIEVGHVKPVPPIEQAIQVSNTGQPTSTNTGNTASDHARAFTTGGSVCGYFMTGIDLQKTVGSPDHPDPTMNVSTWTSDENGRS